MIILGDTNNSHFSEMKSRLKKLGDVRQILDNVSILRYDAQEKENTVSNIRNKIALPGYGYCIVIRLTKDFSCAWSLDKESSKFLVNLTNGREDGKEE